MLVQRYTFTIFTLLLFIFMLWNEGMLGPAYVSPETTSGPRSPIVKQGVTQDGAFALTAIVDAPSVPPRVKIGNPKRDLRAFMAPGRGGILALYIESVEPRAYYVIAGSITPAPKYPTLIWLGPTLLQFYGTDPSGLLYQIEIDVRSLSVSAKPIEGSMILDMPAESPFGEDL